MIERSPRAAAKKSSGRTLIQRSVLLLLFASFVPATFSSTLAERKQTALAQFEAAEQLRAELEQKPPHLRTRSDYEPVLRAYRAVYHKAPTSLRADPAAFAVAELLAQMAWEARDAQAAEAAIAQYEFLRREYPASTHRFEALIAMGDLAAGLLHDPERSRRAYEEFLKRYPHHTSATEVRQKLAGLDKEPAETPAVKTVSQSRAGQKAEEQNDSPEDTAVTGSRAVLSGVRYWSTPEYTRVAIDLDREITYQSGRVPRPERVFFDLRDTVLAKGLNGKEYELADGFVRRIRLAPYRPGLTRVVLEIDPAMDFSAFIVPNPWRLLVEVRRKPGAVITADTKSSEASSTKDSDTKGASQAADTEELSKSAAPTADSTVATLHKPGEPSPFAAKIPLSEKPRRTRRTQRISDTTAQRTEPAASTSAKTKSKRQAEDAETKSNDAPVIASASAQPVALDAPDIKAANESVTRAPLFPKVISDTQPTTSSKSGVQLSAAVIADEAPEGSEDAPVPDHASPAKASPKATAQTAALNAAVANAPTPSRRTRTLSHEAQPTSSGERSLTRALGLKIGRIVIDAGHGGHDTGTIGPTGYREKDLVLDVALRLGKLLEKRLGADVIYTRDDDTFIPLETRTAIANQEQADLFISVHANSSSDPDARGVETYYLNFTSSKSALEVAARENAASEKTVYELQDLVKNIALKEKLEESREFATDVQRSLWSGLSAKSPSLKNRGVKKAPFIVLIGAHMPSILAEISFLSNSSDERRLRTPAYRQKIAEALYRGIARYTGGLSGVKMAANSSGKNGSP